MMTFFQKSCMLAVIAGLAIACDREYTVASGPLTSDVFQTAAVLPVDPFQEAVITTVQNRAHHTMSVLYGNSQAVQCARQGMPYAAGSVVSLVTWTQKEDPYWFGANIPAGVDHVEVVSIGMGAPLYTRYSGSPLKMEIQGSDGMRARDILELKAAVMP